MAAVRGGFLRPHSRADVIVCAKCHQSGDRSLYCIASWILLATGIGSPDGIGQCFTADTRGRHVNIYYSVTYHLTWRHCQLWRPGCPAPSNKHEAAGACHGNLTILHGFTWGAFCSHNSFEVLMQSDFYNLKTYLYWQKHYDIIHSSVQV